MILQTFHHSGLAHLSYLVADEDAGEAVVIDPGRNTMHYLKAAWKNEVRILHILETHIHADFISGSRQLARVTGATICAGAGARYGFKVTRLEEGDEITIGSLTLSVLQTPGHTPEHLSYVIQGGQGSEKPWGIFTGDTLFAGDVGRPDLIDNVETRRLAAQLYHSLHKKIIPLGGDLIVYPAHGAGSPCGAAIGDRQTTTIGYEQRNNPLLRQNKTDFIKDVVSRQSRPPRYYPRVRQMNARGPAILEEKDIPALPAHAFLKEYKKPQTLLLDTREIAAFGGAHIDAALHISLTGPFPVWAGWLIDPKDRILLVTSDASDVSTVLTHLHAIGCENIIGYLHNSLQGWITAGLPFAEIPQLDVHDIKEYLDDQEPIQILDVRSDEEWQDGHIPTAQHIFLPDLEASLDTLNAEEPIAVYCGSGYRASIATSILQREGFEEVYNVNGSMRAWKAAEYPVVK